MSRYTVGGAFSGVVDTNASVVKAQEAYDKSETPGNKAALDAAVANVIAAQTALLPSGLYYSNQAVAADIKDMLLNGSSVAKDITLIGNFVTEIGQGLTLTGLAKTPLPAAYRLGAIGIGELVDLFGVAITSAGVAADSTEIMAYIKEYYSSWVSISGLGSGMIIPSQAPDPSAQYTLLNPGNGTFTLAYGNGVTFTYSGTFQQWNIPDASGNGSSTVYTRLVTGGNSYGEWLETDQSGNLTTLVGPVMGTIPSESLTLTTTGSGTNPFISGAGANITATNNLSLWQSMALAEATGASITFADQSASVTNGNCYTCNLDLSAASGSDQTITLTLTGGANNMVVDGNTKQFINFVNGTATITVPAGQSSLQLTIIDGNSVSTPDQLTLTATIPGPNGTTSNNLNITFNDPAPTATNLNVITGSARPTLVNSVLTPVTIYYADGSNDQISAVDLAGNGLVSINGGAGNDVIIGNGLQDVIIGGNGNNQIYGTTQMTVAAAIAQQSTAQFNGQKAELIAVGDGNNTIIGGNGNDDIFTGVGNNTIVCGAGTTFLLGGVDIYSALFGGSQSSMNWSQSLVNGVWQLVDIYGQVTPFTTPTPYYGNLFGGYAVDGGNDTIYGGTGNSVYGLSNGNNWLDAGGGNDLIQAGVGKNTIYGGTGNDTILGGGGTNYIDLESGNDIVVLYGGNQTVVGGTGNDTIYSGDDTSNNGVNTTGATNYIEGGSGNTTLYGSGGNDTLISGSESGTGKATYIVAGNGNEYIEGGAGNDTIFGGTGINTIYAGEGANAIQLSSTVTETSTVYGGDGNDSISAANDFEWRMQA